MATLKWGEGGNTKSTNTSGPGDGWTTAGLPFPNPRAIYDATKPIHVSSVAAIAGSGSRAYAYAIGSTYQASAYHTNVADSQTFAFRVTRVSGNISLGLLQSGDYTTKWLDGSVVNWSPNGEQPGQMVYELAPSAPGVTSITPTGVSGQVVVLITPPSDNGGATVTTYTHQFSTVSNFATIVAEVVSPSSSTTVGGLPTGVLLYHRVMAVNAVTVGVGKKGGAASATKSFTLGAAPTTAPAIAVTSSVAGTAANLVLTPPSDLSGGAVIKYLVTYEPVSSAGASTGPPTTVEVVGVTGQVVGLTPGQRYKWSAIAVNAAGSSPASAAVFVTQNFASRAPGDYFDGNTVASGDQTFAWSGTANLSTSTMSGHAPTGWQDFVTGSALSGGLGRVARVIGGVSRTYAARATFWTDATGAGFYMGLARATLGRAAVVAQAQYTGSIYVELSRTNLVAVVITWLSAGNVVVGTSLGLATMVGPGAMVRLSVTADAPVGAEFAAVGVVDVAGAGHTNYQAGDYITADAAMISLGPDLLPYFDGSFVDASGNYVYSWLSPAPPADPVPDASPSQRVTQVVPAADPLADPDCVALPLPPRPPIVLDECIDDVPIWRRYWVEIPSTEVSDWMVVLPTLIMETGCNPDPVTQVCRGVRQVRLRVYPNPFARALEDADLSSWCSEQIVSYIPPNSTLTIDAALQRVFAEVNGGPSIAADHLLYGTGGIPATWPELTCGIGYFISFDVPVDAPVGNITTSVYLTRRM